MTPELPKDAVILITGATGFTGRTLTRRLVKAGYTVRAIARNSSHLGDLEALPIQWFRGEVSDPDLIQKAAEGVQFIFHLATLYRDSRADRTEHERVHVHSTRLLAEAAARQPDFIRFVHVSTIGVHGHIENPPADETAPYRPGDDYQETKLEAELWLKDFAGEHALSYTILRPAAIYGPEDERLLKLFRMATKPFFLLVGKGKCLYHLIHVEDLVEIMLRAAIAPEAEAETFICGNPHPISLERIGKLVTETLDQRFRVIRIPAAPLFGLAWLCEKICPVLHMRPPLYRRRVAFFTKDRSFDTRKVQTLLKWSPNFDNESGIIATAKTYRTAGRI
jgi:nucleoside-diphosphate-sugar epimerase